MSEIPPQGMSQVIPYLFYQDVPKAMDWLENAFGFERVLIHPTPNNRHHGEMRCGSGIIMMGDIDGRIWDEDPSRCSCPDAWYVCIPRRGRCSFRARQSGRGGKIQEPVDRDFGRTYWARDLDGHDWFFTTPPS